MKSFNISEKGLKADVLGKVARCADMPDKLKAALAEMVDHVEGTAVTLDCHGLTIKGKMVLHLDISPLF